jgi:hypothetical protein
MKDGVGELSLEQCRLITKDWSIHSDSRPLVAARLWKEIARLRAACPIELDSALESVEAAMREIVRLRAACRSHACPDDGSTDTRCYPDNHTCQARELGGEPECVCQSSGQPHGDGKECETVHRADGPCYRKEPECCSWCEEKK